MFVPSSWGIFVYKLEKSIDTRTVKSFRLDFSLYPMSRDQFPIFGFDHVVEVFGRSCVTNIVLFSGPWTNTSKRATMMGSFFWPSTSGKHESRLKLTNARQEMPNEASNVNTSQAIGKWQSRLWERTGSYTPNSWVFIFSQMESRRLKRRRPYF